MPFATQRGPNLVPVPHTAPPPAIDDPVLSEDFLAEIRKAEGVRTVVYGDVGRRTVGIGHLLPRESHLEIGDSVTSKDVERWFAQDIAIARRQAELDLEGRHGVLAWDSLSVRHRQLLVDLAFNAGTQGFRKLKRALLEGRAADAEQEATRFARLGTQGELVEIPQRSEAARAMVREGFAGQAR